MFRSWWTPRASVYNIAWELCLRLVVQQQFCFIFNTLFALFVSNKRWKKKNYSTFSVLNTPPPPSPRPHRYIAVQRSLHLFLYFVFFFFCCYCWSQHSATTSYSFIRIMMTIESTIILKLYWGASVASAASFFAVLFIPPFCVSSFFSLLLLQQILYAIHIIIPSLYMCRLQRTPLKYHCVRCVLCGVVKFVASVQTNAQIPYNHT